MEKMKLIFFILLTSTLIFSQDSETGITMSGTMGSVTIDGNIYNQIALRPEIPLGNMGLGLDLYIYFNDDGIYEGNWDFSTGSSTYKTLIDKIYYLRWGHPGDNLYFLAGALNDVTLGQGILVNHYSNVMQYPEVRRVGLDFKIKFMDSYHLELIHSDFKHSIPGVTAGRISYGVFPRLEIGLSFASDANQFAGLIDSDGDDVPDVMDDFPDDPTYQLDSDGDGLADNDPLETDIDGDGLDYPNDGMLNENVTNFDDFENFANDFNFQLDADSIITNPKSTFNLNKNIESIHGIALDATFKLSNRTQIYGQFGKLIGKTVLDKDYGWGFSFPGIFTTIGPFDFKAEYRQSSNHFMFSYWDRAYDLTRSTIDESVDTILTKSDELDNITSLKGIYADVSSDILNLIWFNVAYQKMMGDIDNNSLLATLRINTSSIPKLVKAEVFYQQSNVENTFDFDPSISTMFGYELGFEVSDGMTMLYQSRTTYEYDTNGDLIQVPSMKIETQMRF